LENDLRSFFEIKLFIFARTFDIRLLEFGNNRPSESRADQIPAEIGRNPAMLRSRQDLAKMAGIRPDLAKMVGIWPDLDGSGHWSGQIWPDPEEFGRNPAKHAL
jgi:hypothetical protein